MKFVNKIVLSSDTSNNLPLEFTDITVIIEREPFVLDKTIQTVYKYMINDMLVITYYTNGIDTQLFPVYHNSEIWPKEKLEKLLERYLPKNTKNL